MAEMVGGGGGGKKGGGPKAKKKSTRIDMTAMVDVAFLLLTFFVLTATMSNSSLMDLTMPPLDKEDKPVEQVEIREDKVMTIIPCANDTIKYYVGITDAEVKIATSDTAIRTAISAHINRYQPLCQGKEVTNCWDPIFVIKPRYNSRYQTFVDLMDEMAITGAKKYAVTDFLPEDSTTLVKLEEKAK